MPPISAAMTAAARRSSPAVVTLSPPLDLLEGPPDEVRIALRDREVEGPCERGFEGAMGIVL
jgi:hypothetical protein